MTSATDDLRLAADFAPATYDDWRKLVDGVLKGAPFERLVGKTYDGLKIEPIYSRARDTTPVAGIIRVPMVVLLNPLVPAKTLAEFIDYAKANPEKVNMASAGNGSAPHMAGELFKTMAGVNLVHIPYRGQGPALTDLLGGDVQVLFATDKETLASLHNATAG